VSNGVAIAHTATATVAHGPVAALAGSSSSTGGQQQCSYTVRKRLGRDRHVFTSKARSFHRLQVRSDDLYRDFTIRFYVSVYLTNILNVYS